MTTRTPAPTAVDEQGERPSRLLRGLGVLVALLMVLFWIWILAGGPKKANPDRLEDRAYAERTERRCGQLLTDLKALPPAETAADATDRAAVLDQATTMVQRMVDDISADAPTTGKDAVPLRGWFRDWRTYLSDREAYAERLRSDPDAQFRVTENTELRDGVDKTIEIFADVNDMPSCATPGDVG